MSHGASLSLVVNSPFRFPLVGSRSGEVLNASGDTPAANPGATERFDNGMARLHPSLSGGTRWEPADKRLLVFQHGPHRLGCQKMNATTGPLDVVGGFKPAENRIQGRSGDVGKQSDLVLAQIDSTDDGMRSDADWQSLRRIRCLAWRNE